MSFSSMTRQGRHIQHQYQRQHQTDYSPDFHTFTSFGAPTDGKRPLPYLHHHTALALYPQPTLNLLQKYGETHKKPEENICFPPVFYPFCQLIGCSAI
jgi:hypothetical protein